MGCLFPSESVSLFFWLGSSNSISTDICKMRGNQARDFQRGVIRIIQGRFFWGDLGQAPTYHAERWESIPYWLPPRVGTGHLLLLPLDPISSCSRWEASQRDGRQRGQLSNSPSTDRRYDCLEPIRMSPTWTSIPCPLFDSVNLVDVQLRWLYDSLYALVPYPKC